MGIMTKKDQEHLRKGAWHLTVNKPQPACPKCPRGKGDHCRTCWPQKVIK